MLPGVALEAATARGPAPVLDVLLHVQVGLACVGFSGKTSHPERAHPTRGDQSFSYGFA